MKKLLFFLVTFMAITAFFPVSANAQQSSPPWFIVFEETVSPANYALFMEVQKEAVDLWKKHNLDIPVYAYSNDDNALYWVIPIHNFGSIDTLFQKMGQFSQKLQAEGYDGDAKFRDLSTVSSTVMMWVPEMSYHYSGSLAQDPQKAYAEWMFVYLLSGHEKEAGEAFKKFQAYYTDNKLDYSWDTFRVLLGEDTPVMIGLFRDENPVVLKEKNTKIWQEHGAELNKLWAEVTKHARKIENKTGWYNAGLSHQPAMEVTGPAE